MRRHVMLILIGLLVCLLAGLWWRYAPPPASGGGLPDSAAATRLKNQAYAGVPALDEQGFARLTPQNAGSWQAVFQEPIQTFEFYQSQNPTRPTAQRRTIVLQPIGPMSVTQQLLLRDLKEYCEAFFQLPARLEKPLSLDLAKDWTRPKAGPAPGFSTGSGQYNTAKIIKYVLTPRLPDDAAAYLGITMADLWSGNLGFVFGSANFANRTGVYSLCRYYPEFWGRRSRPSDARRTLRRACQVLNHETGHMLGLMHCVLYKCSMNGSNSLGDADATPLEYCPICHRKLLWNLGCDGAQRYGDLLSFYRKQGMETEARWMQSRLARWKRIAATSARD